MSTAPLLSTIERRQAYRLGQLSYDLGKAEAREHQARALEAERLIEALGDVLDLSTPTLQEIGRADPNYFTEPREKLLEALKAWGEDRNIPVCLACGSPRVDWIEWGGATPAPDGGAEAQGCGWCCQDCGAIEDTTGEERRGRTSFAVNDQTKGVSL